MTIYLHADSSYWVRFLDQYGVTQEMDTHCSTKEEAERMCKAAKIEELETVAKVMLLSGEAITRITAGKDIRVDDSMVEFDKAMAIKCNSPRTRDNIVSTVKLFIRETGIGQLHPASVTEAMVDGWINDPHSRTKASTRRVRLSYLRSYFDFLNSRGWSARNPSKIISVKWSLLTHEQKATKEKEIFTDEEVDRLVDGLDGFARDAVVIARDVGLRIGDICNLEFACFHDGHIKVFTDKADTLVELPTTERVDAIASRRRTEVVGNYLFPEEREIQNRPAGRGAISTLFIRKFRDLGFAGRSIHSLRASYATAEYLRAERQVDFNQDSVASVGRKLGHAAGSSATKVYLRTQA